MDEPSGITTPTVRSGGVVGVQNFNRFTLSGGGPSMVLRVQSGFRVGVHAVACAGGIGGLVFGFCASDAVWAGAAFGWRVLLGGAGKWVFGRKCSSWITFLTFMRVSSATTCGRAVATDAAEDLHRVVDAAYEIRSVAVSSNLHPRRLRRTHAQNSRHRHR